MAKKQPEQDDRPQVGGSAEQTAMLLDLTVQHMRELGRNGIIPQPVDGKWQTATCCVLYIRWLRDGKNAEAKASTNRKRKADAQMAEMDAAKMERTLCDRADYKSNYADAIAQGAQRISRLRSLNTKQKEEVLLAIRGIKLLPLPDEEDRSDEDDA